MIRCWLRKSNQQPTQDVHRLPVDGQRVHLVAAERRALAEEGAGLLAVDRHLEDVSVLDPTATHDGQLHEQILARIVRSRPCAVAEAAARYGSSSSAVPWCSSSRSSNSSMSACSSSPSTRHRS